MEVATVRMRYAWDHRIRPRLIEADREITDEPGSIWWRDNTIVLVTPLDFGSGDPLLDLRDELVRECRVIDPTVQALVWEHHEPGRRRKTSERVLLDAADLSWTAAQTSMKPGLRRVILQSVDAQTANLFNDVAVAGVSRDRLWLVSRDPYFRGRLGTTPGAAYALYEAANRSTGRKKINHTVVLDPSWPWPWVGLVEA